MQQQDFLQKQYEQLGRVLGKILTDLLDIKNKGTIISNHYQIHNQFLKTELDIDLDDWLDLKADAFIDQLNLEKGFNNHNLEKLAHILEHLADNSLDTKKKKAFYEKALITLNLLDNREQTYSLDRLMAIKKIEGILESMFCDI